MSVPKTLRLASNEAYMDKLLDCQALTEAELE
jgi:hypothetical protein